jgi:hypothetical protein
MPRVMAFLSFPYLGCQMVLLNRITISLLLAMASTGAFAQLGFSVASDLSVLRNFSPNQQFWAIGHTIQANYHVTEKDGVYGWLSYYSPGRFENEFTATAKQPATVPQQVRFEATGRWNYRNISLGWKHYFRGTFTQEETWSLYGLAGFGLQFTRVRNEYMTPIDTSLYEVNAPVEGEDGFKRLTLDLGAGVEYPLGPGVYAYGDLRTWLPASGYPSPYLHDTRKVPLPLTLGAGLRITF